MPWQWRWNPDITCYTGTEYKEVLREKYGLPADWEPTEPPPGQEPSTSPGEALESRPHAPTSTASAVDQTDIPAPDTSAS
jgi:hypothetical protein